MKTALLLLSVLLFFTNSVQAARTINSATVDGASSTAVSGGATISAVVNVLTDGNGSNGRWRSTGWRIAGSSGALTCVDHTDYQSSSGNFSETFNITAPAIDGVYNLYLVAYRNDVCSQGASTEFILSNAVTVGATQLSVSTENVSQDYDVSSYGGSSQDVAGTVEIRDVGLSLFLEGNRWQKIDFPYTVTADTMIEFDFQSTVQGEVHGLGFDDDLGISSNRSFRVYGTQNWGLSNFATYTGSGLTHFTIPVGQFYTGNFQYLFFMNDDDSNPTGNSLYSNIEVYEKVTVISDTPLAEYRFDELSWDGTPSEVLDSSGNNHNGVATGMTTLLGGKICSAGDFTNTGTGDYLSLANTAIDGLSDFTVSVWAMKNVIDTGSILSGANAGQNNEMLMFFPGDSTFQPYIIGSNVSLSNGGVGDGNWHHLVWTRTGINQCYYVDGALVQCGNINRSGALNIDPGGLIVGQEQDALGGGFDASQAWDGLLDELIIFDSALPLSKITDIYTNQDAGNNYDGSPRACPEDNGLVAHYEMEEASWGTVIDSMNGINGVAYNGADTIGSSCRYGQFDGVDDYVQIPHDDQLNGSDALTYVALVRADSWGGVTQIMSKSVHGGGSGRAQMGMFSEGGVFKGRAETVAGRQEVTMPLPLIAGDWDQLGLVFADTSLTLYKNGIAQASTSFAATTLVQTTDPLNISKRVGTNTYYFHGLIDDVRVYTNALTAQEMLDLYNSVTPCPLTAVDHFTINHDNSGIHCLAEPVSVTAKNADDTIATGYTGTITLDTQLLSTTGTWELVTGAGVFIDATANDGEATYTFGAADNGVASFTLYYPEGEATFDIDVFDGAIRDDDLENNITFAANGFTITASELTALPPNDPILTQIAGTAFDVYITAFGELPDDDACGIIETYIGNKNLTLSTTHDNPTSGTVNILSSGLTTATLNFSGGKADSPLNVKYKDVGAVSLGISEPAFTNISYSNSFVVKPASFEITPTSLPTSNPFIATGPGGTVFTSAGTTFAVAVTAKDSEGATTPNYGNELSPETVAPLTATLNQPSGGDPGVFTSSNLTDTGGGIFSGTANWSEVGTIDLSTGVGDSDYLGTGNVTSTLTDVGRFTPHHFAITSPDNGMLGASCLGSFSYIGQEFGYLIAPSFIIEAQNTSNTPTLNYQGSNWAKILSGGAYAVNTVTEDDTQVGTDLITKLAIYHELPTNRINIDSDNGDGTFNVSFGADVFCYGSDDLVNNGGCDKAVESQVAPFNSDIKLTLSSIGDGDITTTLTQDFSPTASQQRFGRLSMDNTFGSELVDLAMPMYTEIFDGSNFVLNNGTLPLIGGDNCSVVNTAGLDISPSLTGGTSNVTVSPSTANAGVFNLNLTAPGAGNTGSILIGHLPTTVDSWLKYDWDGGGTYDDDPSATATFGIYKGNPVQIYIQQTYQ